jgi:hypothetical protein
MAILKKGPNGGFSGKIGKIVGYEVHGQDIIRGCPGKRTTKPSAKEQANRDKFALLQRWLQPLTDFLRIGFKSYAPTFQGFVAAKSYNSKHALKQNDEGAWFIDPALAMVSFGTLPLPQTMSMERVGNEIVISWSKEDSHRGLDQVMVLAYMPESGIADMDFTLAKRDDGSARFPMPFESDGLNVHVYISFVKYDHSAQSNSQYLGTIS